jgi:hypothetical protein
LKKKLACLLLAILFAMPCRAQPDPAAREWYRKLMAPIFRKTRAISPKPTLRSLMSKLPERIAATIPLGIPETRIGSRTLPRPPRGSNPFSSVPE